MKKFVFIAIILLLLVILPTNDTELLKASIGGNDITAAIVGLVMAILMRETKSK